MLTICFFLLFCLGIEANDSGVSMLKNSFMISLDICLRTSVKIAPDNKMTSLTNRVILFTTMMFGFIVFSHYEALLATMLIVEADNMPYKNWDDVLHSGKNVLVWEAAVSELKFKVPPETSTLRKIFDNQIGYMNDVGFQGSIPGLVNDEYLVFESLKGYELYPEYPCHITSADSFELK